MRHAVSSLALAGALLGLGFTPGASLALTHATIVEGAGRIQHDVTIVLAGDRILAVGPAVTAPAGTHALDMRGHVITPGLFDAASQVGLAEVGNDDEADQRTGGDTSHPVSAGVRVADGFDPVATAVPVTSMAGVTLAALVPSGGMLSGQGAVVDLLGGPDLGGRVVLPSVGLFGTFAPQDADMAGTASDERLMGAWRELLAVARLNLQANSLNDHLPFMLGLTDLAPLHELATGSRTLFLAAHSAHEIRQALAFGREQHVKLVLTGVEEGWMLAHELAAAHVPVILNPFEDLPTSLDRRGSRLDNAALLDRAGVELAFGTWSYSNARDLRQAAGIAVANGLPWAKAWQAVTRVPAKLYGVGGRYGELAAGRQADLVVWDGDPFEAGTDVLALYSAGRSIPVDSRQLELARRYRHLPLR